MVLPEEYVQDRWLPLRIPEGKKIVDLPVKDLECNMSLPYKSDSVSNCP